MSLKRVAVDFDGTLADTASFVCELINFKRDAAISPNDVTHWDWWDEHGFDKDFWAAYDLMDRTHLRRAIRPISPLACAIIKYLQQGGHYEFEVVTMNKERAAADMVAWLFGHGLDIPVRAVGRIGVEKKTALGYDMFIDDAPQLAEAVAKLPDKWMILVDQPWNRAFVCRGYGDDQYQNNNVVRMKDWSDALAIFEAIK
jgi:5'(3')-deoxyribonucleotidase